MSTDSSIIDMLRGAKTTDTLATLIAGGVNGYMLMASIEQIGGGWTAVFLSGIFAYAVTTLVSRILSLFMAPKNTRASIDVLGYDLKHLLFAGIINGLVFSGLRPMLPFGTVYQILAGAFAYYFIEFLGWAMAQAS